jgi:phosphate/sulfate permease
MKTAYSCAGLTHQQLMVTRCCCCRCCCRPNRFQKKINDMMRPVEVDPNDKSMSGYWKRFRNAALSGMNHDIHDDIKDDEGLQEMHADAERFDPRTEEVFKVLQVISACAMAFAHGANDVANAIGPFAAALYVYNNFQVPSNNSDVSGSPAPSIGFAAAGLKNG